MDVSGPGIAPCDAMTLTTRLGTSACVTALPLPDSRGPTAHGLGLADGQGRNGSLLAVSALFYQGSPKALNAPAPVWTAWAKDSRPSAEPARATPAPASGPPA